MQRRAFITLLGGAAFAYPFAARAQPSDQVRRVAVLGPTPAVWGVWVAGFAERLRELGWIKERTIAIEYRWSEGRPERVAEAAADFVRQKPDLIVTYGGAVPAFKQATTSIPIVFVIAVDPSASAWSTTSRIQAVTSPGCRFNRTTRPASVLNFCTTLSPACAGWRSCLTADIARP
jgi:putative tryptophan/tyrosine transport system substrate-binding protein